MSPAIFPTRVGLRVAMPPRAEKSAPTQWGAGIVVGLYVPHRRESAVGRFSTRNSYFSLALYTSDFMLPTSSTPHAWGLKANGFLDKHTFARSSPQAWGLKHLGDAKVLVGMIFPTRVGSESHVGERGE